MYHDDDDNDDDTNNTCTKGSCFAVDVDEKEF